MKLLVFSISAIAHVSVFALFLLKQSDSSSGTTQSEGVRQTVISQAYIKFHHHAPRPEKELPEPEVSSEVVNANDPNVVSEVLGLKEQNIEKSLQPEEQKIRKQQDELSPVVKEKILLASDTEIEEGIQEPNVENSQHNASVSDAPLKRQVEQMQNKTLSAEDQSRTQGDDAQYTTMGAQGKVDSEWLRYQEGIFAAINAQKIYPKQARLRKLEGTVIVEFEVDAEGNIKRFDLISKTTSNHLNSSTLQLFTGLKLPKPSQDLAAYFPSVMTIPIEYSLN